jgi:hypothetical protein
MFDVRRIQSQKSALRYSTKSLTSQKTFLQQLLRQEQSQSYKQVSDAERLFKIPDFSSGSSGGSGRRLSGWFYGEHNRKFRNLNKLLGL